RGRRGGRPRTCSRRSRRSRTRRSRSVSRFRHSPTASGRRGPPARRSAPRSSRRCRRPRRRSRVTWMCSEPRPRWMPYGCAGARGVAGYLLRFPDWRAARWCLERGIPIIASVRYAAGELGGAAVAATSGHLLVLVGLEGDTVLVNDPAAPTAASVPRRYRADELGNAWLARGGIGHVLFDLARL